MVDKPQLLPEHIQEALGTFYQAEFVPSVSNKEYILRFPDAELMFCWIARHHMWKSCHIRTLPYEDQKLMSPITLIVEKLPQ
jgi:hypothetical protein